MDRTHVPSRLELARARPPAPPAVCRVRKRNTALNEAHLVWVPLRLKTRVHTVGRAVRRMSNGLTLRASIVPTPSGRQLRTSDG